MDKADKDGGVIDGVDLAIPSNAVASLSKASVVIDGVDLAIPSNLY